MNLPPLPGVSTVLLYGGSGVLLGLLHFSLLRWNTELYLRARLWALGLQLLRLAAVLAALVLLARGGAWPLLLTLGGFTIGRTLVLRRLRVP